MSVEIKTGQGGSCPHSSKGIKKIKEDEFAVYPQWRETTGRSEEAVDGIGARLEILLANKSGKDQNVILHVDWQFPKKDSALVPALRDFAYIKHGNGWKMVFPSDVSGSVVTFWLPVPAGTTSFAQYPSYNLTELNGDLKSWKKQGALVSCYGKSDKELELPLVRIGKKGKDKEKVLLLIRNHAYETAGSYCCRGIIDFLLSKDELAGYLNSRFYFVILPMTNIDGVEDGMSRLTAPQGANLNRYNTEKDASHKAMLELIDKEKPELAMNYHNWQSKFIDGMWCPSEFYKKKIIYYLSGIAGDFKELEAIVVAEKKFDPGFEKASIQDYIEHKYGSTTVTYEFPWFSRSTARMEQLGKESLLAFLMARIEEKQVKAN